VRCERPKCPCGNAEISDLQTVLIGGVQMPVPFCEKAIAIMQKEMDAWPKNANKKRDPSRAGRRKGG
jgi:hypothetical protein